MVVSMRVPFVKASYWKTESLSPPSTSKVTSSASSEQVGSVPGLQKATIFSGGSWDRMRAVERSTAETRATLARMEPPASISTRDSEDRSEESNYGARFRVGPKETEDSVHENPESPARRLQEREEIRELLPRELLVEPLRHDGDGARLHACHLGPRNAHLLVRGRGEHHLVIRVLLQGARVRIPGRRLDDDGLVAPREAHAREEDGLDEIALRADLAYGREVGTQPAAQVADRVARGACRLRAVEDRLSAPDVAALQRGRERLDGASLLLGVDVEGLEELARRILDTPGELREALLQGPGRDRREACGLLERGHDGEPERLAR